MNNNESSAASEETFDYVVVGAGSAGCVLAERLSADGRYTVCVLEAGPADRHPFIHLPAGYIKTLANPRYLWSLKTEPVPGAAGRVFDVSQGRTLGGSSSVNGLCYNRGQAEDFDAWSAAGNPGWSYREVLPYFRRSESFEAGPDTYRGGEGPLKVSKLHWRHPILDAFMQGARDLGIPDNPDYNGAEQTGVGLYQRTIHAGRRMSTARAFLRGAMGRRNLSVRTEAVGRVILFEGRRAVGVRYRRGASDVVVRARREVVLSAGTVNTTKLLQLSGIGPAELLREFGIPVVHAVPGLGENLRDHFAVRMVAQVKNSLTLNELSRPPRLFAEALRWALGRPGLLSLSPSLVHVFWKSDPVLASTDLQFTFTPASYKASIAGLLDNIPGMSCGVWQQRPESRGHIRIRSSDPNVQPAIQPNYLDHPVDRRVQIAGVRIGRQLMASQPLSRYYDHEVQPGPDIRSDDEVLDYLRRGGSTVYHLIGTVRMGPEGDPGAVVDHELKVRGIDGLRVADASVMPSMPSANTNAATIMIAEKAADMILGRSPLAPAQIAPRKTEARRYD